MAYAMAPEVPDLSTMAVPYGPMGVGLARRRMRAELQESGADDTVVDDALLILSELLSNSCRHASPLPPDDSVRADWTRARDGRLTISVTDGGGPTRPLPATPSMTAHGGRGLSIITSLARDWGVEDRGEGGVTVWAVIAPPQHGVNASARLTGVGLTGMRGVSGSRSRRPRRSTPTARSSHRAGTANSAGSGAPSRTRTVDHPGPVDGAGMGTRPVWHGERREVTRAHELFPGTEPLTGGEAWESPEALEERRELERLTGLTDFTHLDGLAQPGAFEGHGSFGDVAGLDGLAGDRSQRLDGPGAEPGLVPEPARAPTGHTDE